MLARPRINPAFTISRNRRQFKGSPPAACAEGLESPKERTTQGHDSRMPFDFKHRIQNVNGYGDEPFTFLDHDAHKFVGHIASIDLIENGDRLARENWQRRRLGQLVNHAYVRSNFWRQRIPSGVSRQDILGNMPALTRKDVASQVNKEGSLFVDKKQGEVSTYETTGSTGTPLKIFVCPQNGYYNSVRSLAQFFIDDLSLDENWVKIVPVFRSRDLRNESILKVAKDDHWAGILGKIYRNGSSKNIPFSKDIDRLIAELSKERVGYLLSPSRVVEQLLDHGGADLFGKLGIKLWIHLSDYRSQDAVQQLKQIGIPSLSNYTSGETGPIAYECRTNEGYYHVAHTNVIVESDDKLTTSFDGVTVGRLLITHLHSYATPLIRYDIGDFGKLHHQCPCGHDGPTISHIYGRGKHFLRHPEGGYLLFYVSTRLLREAVEFKECRFQQETIDTITVQIGGRETLSPEEEAKLKALIVDLTNPAFKVVVKPVREIDWSDNPKQLLFSSSVV
jgi:phenylacetate-coenzyme A ligase PaaK-like adenylate-forming protein